MFIILHFLQDNAELISEPAIKKFATSFMKNGNINLINDVIKSIHKSYYKIDQVLFIELLSIKLIHLYFNQIDCLDFE